MGWTDDSDTEGLIEENPFIFIALGIIAIGVAGVLYYFGIDYDPGWFEGQNIISTMGIIFLIIFIPAIAISTLTGKSDLVKWEALFLIISVAMIWLGSNFDIINALTSKFATWASVDWTVKDLLTIVLIITLIAMAISSAWGKGVGTGTALLAIICIVGIYLVNNPAVAESISDGSFFEKLGKATSDMTKGAVGEDLGRLVGIGVAGATAGALVGSIVPGIGTGIGAAVGAGLAVAAELLWF